SARAAAFAEELFIAPEMDASRFQIVGHADTMPLVPNLDAETRERNRRVEIIILRSQEDDDDDQPLIQPETTPEVEDAFTPARKILSCRPTKFSEQDNN